MNEVCENVCIGDRSDALNCLSNDLGVRCILTIDIEPIENDEQISTKHVRCFDEPEADLLSYLDECIQFIQKGLEKSKVLVHCFAGVSRSTTVVLAYMMKTQNIGLEEALEQLKTVYPKANPNPGFMYQLQLFEAMGKQVDISSSLYKQFRLQITANKLEISGYEKLSHEMLKDLTKTPTTSSQLLKENNYKCRKCSFLLFKSSNCLQHMPGSGQEFLPWYKKSFVQENQKMDKSNCTSYFIEPVNWMMPLLLGTMQGKLACPKCSGRIGSFNWAGEQCSCGRWITPAFQLHKSRIDER